MLHRNMATRQYGALQHCCTATWQLGNMVHRNIGARQYGAVQYGSKGLRVFKRNVAMRVRGHSGGLKEIPQRIKHNPTINHIRESPYIHTQPTRYYLVMASNTASHDN